MGVKWHTVNFHCIAKRLHDSTLTYHSYHIPAECCKTIDHCNGHRKSALTTLSTMFLDSCSEIEVKKQMIWLHHMKIMYSCTVCRGYINISLEFAFNPDWSLVINMFIFTVGSLITGSGSCMRPRILMGCQERGRKREAPSSVYYSYIII